MLRIANLSSLDGDVSISAYDDSGELFGPITLALGALQTVHLSSDDVEQGNEEQGLSEGVGEPTQGDWWLRITSDLDVKILSYIETSDEFLTSLHDVVPIDDGVYTVGVFNPASETNNESWLRVVNAGSNDAVVAIYGIDDHGDTSDSVQFSLAAYAALTLTADDLENGHTDLVGSLGSGDGRWRLVVESDQQILVMSLLSGSNGLLANLSTDPSVAGSTSVADEPPAPEVVIVSNTQIQYSWSWAFEANEVYAFDHHIRAAGNPWLENCTVQSSDSSAEETITVNFTNDSTIPDGTVIEVRYRYRNGSSCTTGSPGPWSAIGSGTVGDDSNGGDTDMSDLVVSAVSVSEETVEASASVTLTATVNNQGDGEASATTLRYLRSSNALITQADTQIGETSIDSLAAGAETNESIQFDVPSVAGTYYFGACVDAVANESSATNNCSTAARVEVTETVQTGSPDLVINSIVLSEVDLTVDQSFTITATVGNQGDGNSPVTTLRYFRSANSTITTQGSQIGIDSVSALASGAEGEESISLTAPSAEGTYYFGVCVDTVTDEADTTNNCSTGVRVEVTAPAQTESPDLVINSILLSEVDLTVDQSFTITATVGNQGDGNSPATTLRYFRSANSTISTQDSEIGSDSVSALAGGAEAEESISLTAPSDAGTYYFGVCVDAVTDEADTDNNCSTGVRVEVTDEDEPADTYCRPNLTIQPGSRCDIYSRTNEFFNVSSNGVGCYRAGGLMLCSSNSLNYRGAVINNVTINFVASRNDDDSWTISIVEPAPP